MRIHLRIVSTSQLLHIVDWLTSSFVDDIDERDVVIRRRTGCCISYSGSGHASAPPDWCGTGEGARAGGCLGSRNRTRLSRCTCRTWSGCAFACLPVAFQFVRIIGACYLVWLAIGILRHPLPAVDAVGGMRERRSYLASARKGLFTNLLNPKALLFSVQYCCRSLFTPRMAALRSSSRCWGSDDDCGIVVRHDLRLYRFVAWKPVQTLSGNTVCPALGFCSTAFWLRRRAGCGLGFKCCSGL